MGTGTAERRLALVVDDDPDVAMVCTLHLEGAGFAVARADTGVQAVALAVSSKPVVIVLDHMLPDIDGLEVLRRLRDDENTAEIPVVMVTARTRERDRVAAWDAGVSDLLTKPFEGSQLVRAVHTAAGRGDTTARGSDGGAVPGAQDAIIATTLSGEVTSWNDGARRMLGWQPDEVVGLPLSRLTSSGHDVDLRELLGDPGREPPAAVDLPCLHRDGRRLHVSLSVSPVRDRGGRVLGASVVARDVTEWLRTERQFRTLVEAAPDGIVIVDGDGRIELVNRRTEELFGHPRSSLLGEPVEMLVPAQFRDRHAELRRGYVERPRNREMGAGLRLSGLKADGTEFPVEVSLSPLDSDHGTSYAATVRDVTDRRRAESAQLLASEREREATARLREVDRLRSDFLSTVSHELRTPLTAIKGFAEHLVNTWDATPDQQRRDMVYRILHAGGRLDFLIQDLLDFSKLERGHLKVELSTHHLSSLVEESLAHAVPSLERHGIATELDDSALVLADRSAMIRVIENLLTNAAKFSPAGSTIEICTRQVADDVILTVRDHGVGIPESEHEKVFDRFYRVPETAPTHPGTGIGLAIVKQFVEAQGGTVTLSSTENGGTEFRLLLRSAHTG